MSAEDVTVLHDPIVILSAARTPLGAFQGAFAALSAPQLGAVAIKAAVERARIDAQQIDELLMGCVLAGGLGQAPARQAALQAGLPLSVGCTVVSKVCGSGMKAAMLGHDGIASGTSAITVVGGMESMSNAPYLLPKARAGYRMGHGQLLDHMFFDGLQDAYSDESRGRLMGTFAQDCADDYRFTRAQQDEFAVRSTVRAQTTSTDGGFAWEIAPVTVGGKKGEVVVAKDEGPFAVNVDKIPLLKPAFRPGGTVTAANSSSISDGAAAMVLTRASKAAELGLQPIARIVGSASHADLPARFPTAPVGAVRKLLAQVGWGVDDVDLWEINEAFAAVTMAAIHDLALDPAKVNVHGGACALGHPIGASGARILVTLLGALRRTGGRRGVASLCIGGGEATAMAVELLEQGGMTM